MFLFHEPSWSKVYFGLAVGAVGLAGLLALRIKALSVARSPAYDPTRFRLDQDPGVAGGEEDEEVRVSLPPPHWNVRWGLPIGIVSLLLLLSGLVYSVTVYRAISNVEEAMKLAARHDLIGAVVAYKKALGALPDSPSVRYQLAKSLTVLKRYKEAQTEYEQSLKGDDTNPDAHIDYANSLLGAGRTDEAIVQYQKAMALAPDNLITYINLGNAYVRVKRYEDAYRQYRYVLQKEPHNIIAHLNLGDALRAGGRKEEGVSECKQAVALAPEDPVIRNNLGNALYSAGNREEAIVQYRRTTELQSDYPAAYFNLANALMDTREGGTLKPEQREEAITALESFLRLAHDHPEYAAGIPKAREYLKKLHGSS